MPTLHFYLPFIISETDSLPLLLPPLRPPPLVQIQNIYHAKPPRTSSMWNALFISTIFPICVSFRRLSSGLLPISAATSLIQFCFIPTGWHDILLQHTSDRETGNLQLPDKGSDESVAGRRSETLCRWPLFHQLKFVAPGGTQPGSRRATLLLGMRYLMVPCQGETRKQSLW